MDSGLDRHLIQEVVSGFSVVEYVLVEACMAVPSLYIHSCNAHIRDIFDT